MIISINKEVKPDTTLRLEPMACMILAISNIQNLFTYAKPAKPKIYGMYLYRLWVHFTFHFKIMS